MLNSNLPLPKALPAASGTMGKPVHRMGTYFSLSYTKPKWFTESDGGEAAASRRIIANAVKLSAISVPGPKNPGPIEGMK